MLYMLHCWLYTSTTEYDPPVLSLPQIPNKKSVSCFMNLQPR